MTREELEESLEIVDRIVRDMPEDDNLLEDDDNMEVTIEW
jgi:hypothetical protein